MSRYIACHAISLRPHRILVFRPAIRRPSLLAGVAFLLGVAIELAQYLAATFGLRISNRILRIVVGATPDWWDVLAYGLGAVIVLGLATRGRFWQRRSIVATKL